jgi:hypothetical protein
MPRAGSSGSMTTRFEPRPHYLAATVLVLLLAQAGARAESSDLLASRLARCVADLNSDEFSVRQRAMRELENAGVEAMPLVAATAKSNDKEIRSRAIGILLAQACSKNAEQRSAARAALAELSESTNGKAADAAQAALKIARDGAAALASAELTRLGAMVERKSSPGENAGLPHYSVMVPQAWTGGDNGLALVSELGDVPFLTMESAPLSDACLIHVAKLTGLTRLYVGSTRITGTGSSLARLAPLTQLQFLSLRQLPIDDARLARLPSFEHLHYLGLDGTQVGDRGLCELARYPRLQMLWLDRTRVSDAGLVHLQALPELYTLFLAGTKVGGPGLAELRHLPRLSYLSLKGNKLEQGSLKLLGQLEQLETLGLDETNVSDDQLADLAGHSRLRKLYLTKTEITDAGLEHLQSLRNLDTLYISETQVSSDGIDGLRKALPNCDVRR